MRFGPSTGTLFLTHAPWMDIGPFSFLPFPFVAGPLSFYALLFSISFTGPHNNHAAVRGTKNDEAFV